MVESTNQKPIVTITGITGYIGSHVCLLFLQDGSYHVRGTVRDKSKPEKMDPIKKSFGDLYDQLEIVEADLMNEESLANAIAGSTFVVHVASPYPAKKPKDENEVIRPAVDGTMAILRACRTNKVKRVVITSSCAAIMDVADEDRPDGAYDESLWSNPDRK